MTAPNYDYVYQPGGSLGFRAPSYVPRQADDDLYEGIKSGRFCYVFNCRQMGKSSLRVRVSKRLEQDGYRCGALDLSALGGDEHLTPAQWYRSLITELNRSLSLLSVAEFDDWLAASNELTVVYALSQFIEDVVLPKTAEQPVVIFIDEIDSVLSLSFDTNDLFAVIRNFYNKRVDNSEYKRLNFALFGVTTPAKLVRNTSRTPFNIGEAIQLTPLSLEKAKPLEDGLVGWVENPKQALKEAFKWSGGQPYLTQKICELLQEEAMEGGLVAASEKVSELVEKHILSNWQFQDEQSHFQTIQTRLLRQEHLVNRVLDLYAQVLEHGKLDINHNDEATIELRLSGAVVQVEKTLRPFNKIYQRIFDASWVKATQANLRPYAATFNTWVSSEHKDETALLRGEALTSAEKWAEGKGLSDLDNRYLRESQACENKAFQKRAKSVAVISVVVAILAGCFTAISLRRLTIAEVKRNAVEDAQLSALSSISRDYSLNGRDIDATIAAVKGGQIIRERKLHSTKIAEPVISVLQQAIYPNRFFDMVNIYAPLIHNNNYVSGLNTSFLAPHNFREYNRLLNNKNEFGVSSSFRDYDSKVIFSSDGKNVAFLYGGSVKVWDANGSEKPISTSNSIHHRVGNRTFLEIVDITFSPDSRRLISVDKQGGVKLWDLAVNENTEFDTGQDDIIKISFSSDGSLLTLISKDGSVKLWDLEGNKKAEFHVEQEIYWNDEISFSHDGQTLASAGQGIVRLWDLQGNEKSISSHKESLGLMSFSPDGKMLAVASARGLPSQGHESSIILLNLEDGEKSSRLNDYNDSVSSLAFSSDGNTLVSGNADGEIRVLDLSGEQQTLLFGHQGAVVSLSFSPDGEILASASSDGTVKLWDLSKNDQATISNYRGEIIYGKFRPASLSPSFSPDGETIAAASEDGVIRLWDLQGNEKGTFFGHRGKVPGVSFSPNGETIASASEDGVIELWNLQGNEKVTFLGHRDKVTSVSFSPNGDIVASASEDGIVKLWDLQGNEKGTFSGHSYPAHPTGPVSVNFSPDGNILASVSHEGSIKLWNLRSDEKAVFFSHTIRDLVVVRNRSHTNSVKFSPDGEIIAIIGNDGIVVLLYFWGKNGQLVSPHLQSDGFSYITLFAHEVTSDIDFSPDGKTLASVGAIEGRVKLWALDVNRGNSLDGVDRERIDGNEKTILPGHHGGVSSIKFSSDGKTLASVGSYDNTIKLWNLDLDSLIAQGCDLLEDYLRHNSDGQKAAEEGVCEDYL
ncbi:MAG: AAA-like domain-containing protein [Cyanobacteria bacterium J06634_6]